MMPQGNPLRLPGQLRTCHWRHEHHSTPLRVTLTDVPCVCAPMCEGAVSAHVFLAGRHGLCPGCRRRFSSCKGKKHHHEGMLVCQRCKNDILRGKSWRYDASTPRAALKRARPVEDTDTGSTPRKQRIEDLGRAEGQNESKYESNACGGYMLPDVTPDVDHDVAMSPLPPGPNADYRAAVLAALCKAMNLRNGEGDGVAVNREKIIAAYIDLPARIDVTAETAVQMLLDVHKSRAPVVMRGFPGAYPPRYRTIDDFVAAKVPLRTRHYSYPNPRDPPDERLHVFLKWPAHDCTATQRAHAWWESVEQHGLNSCGREETWSIFSRGAGSALHTDVMMSASTQFVSHKLWVFVDVDEAKKHRIFDIDDDVMRPHLTKTAPPPFDDCTLDDWLKCPSFRWCILAPGETVVFSSNILHGVHRHERFSQLRLDFGRRHGCTIARQVHAEPKEDEKMTSHRSLSTR